VLVEQGALHQFRAQLVAIPYSLPLPLPVAVEPVAEMLAMESLAVLGVELRLQTPLVQEIHLLQVRLKVTTAAQIQVITMVVAVVVAHLRSVHLFPALLVAPVVTEALGL